MNQNDVKEILFGNGVRPASEEARAGVLGAVKQVIDQLLEEVAAGIEFSAAANNHELDYDTSVQIVRRFKSGSRDLFECKHETQLANSKTLRVVCADCGASLNGPTKN